VNSLRWSLNTAEEVIKVAQLLLGARGYVVFRYPNCTEQRLGQIEHNLWTVPVDQPFVLVAKTTHEDWEEQRKLAAPVVNRPYTPMSAEAMHYYRAVTE
jgi:hypothetical protein